MTYDKEFEEFISDIPVNCHMKDNMYIAWQAARKDHYRIGEEVRSVKNLRTAKIRAVIDWDGGCLYELEADDVRRIPAKSRIDEIAEEAEDKYRRGSVGAGSLTDIIKSAILKDREERGEK